LHRRNPPPRRTIYGQARQEGEWVDPVIVEDDGICPLKTAATNIYEDLTVRFRKATAVWIVQIMLVGLYIQELNSNADTHNVEKVDFGYWLIAVMFQMLAGDSQLGEGYNQKFWCHVLVWEFVEWFEERVFGTAVSPASEEPLRVLEKEEEEEEEEREEKQMKGSFEQLGRRSYSVNPVLNVSFWWEWWLRSVMDFTVNGVARSILLYTVPIMVCVEEPLDFVKDLTAVMFITLLDDIPGDPKDLKEMAVKIKFDIGRQPTQSMRQIIQSRCGYKQKDDRGTSTLKHDNTLPLNRFEKKFVDAPENADRFQRIATLASAEWARFVNPPPRHSV